MKRQEGSCLRKRVTPGERLKALKGESQERSTLKYGWEARWGAIRQGRQNSEGGRCRVRKARGIRTHFTVKRCREENPRRGTAGTREGPARQRSGRHPGGERRPREDGGDYLTTDAGAAWSETPDGPRLVRDGKVARGAANQCAATLRVSNTPKVT